MSDTPRTDEAEFTVMTWPSKDNRMVVRAALSRELERELAVWKHEVDLLRKELAKADKDLEDNISIFIDLKEQRDRLAEALRDVLEDHAQAGCISIEAQQVAEAALDAVKGGDNE